MVPIILFPLRYEDIPLAEALWEVFKQSSTCDPFIVPELNECQRWYQEDYLAMRISLAIRYIDKRENPIIFIISI